MDSPIISPIDRQFYLIYSWSLDTRHVSQQRTLSSITLYLAFVSTKCKDKARSKWREN